MDFVSPPVYNSRIRSNDKTTIERYPWGEVKCIKSTETGPQKKRDELFLIDTILHENLEAKIALGSSKNELFGRLHNATDEERHAYIAAEIDKYFRQKGWK